MVGAEARRKYMEMERINENDDMKPFIGHSKNPIQ
jgi:hypothetical protein